MNKNLIANICLIAMVVGVIAAFMGKISWGEVGLIFIGTIVLAMINGALIGRSLRKHSDE